MSAHLSSDSSPSTIMVPLSGGHSLEVDVYATPGAANRSIPQRIAILCHPWSWLGGCKDDPVLVSLATVLDANFGMHVFVPNSRSVGNSTGRASFSGKSEAADLEELTRWCVNKVGDVDGVVIVGYSHGSLLASCHPVLPAPTQTYHVILSYPLSPLPLLTFFNASTYRERLNQLVQNPRARILILYGDRDQFTAGDNYEAWSNNLQQTNASSAPGAALEIKMIPGGDHFWRGQFNGKMRETISNWLQQYDLKRATAT